MPCQHFLTITDLAVLHAQTKQKIKIQPIDLQHIFSRYRIRTLRLLTAATAREL
jgi:hypothetical protein